MKYLPKLLPLLLLAALPSASRAQGTIVAGTPCGAGGLSAIATNGQAVLCQGNPLIWTSTGGSGGGISSVSVLPATCTPGTTANVSLSVAPFGEWYCDATNHWWKVGSTNPFPTGLIAWYRCLPGDTVATLTDYSGSGNNATATVGTAPTIIAGSGGCNFTGNGAIITPSSLSTALTMQVLINYQQETNSNTYNSPICGNGNGAASNSFCMLLQNPFPLAQPENAVGGPYLFNNTGGFTASVATIINGSAVLSASMAAVDHAYINGDEVCQDPANATSVCANTLSSAGKNLFPFQLGGTAAGSGIATQTYFTGQIYGVAFYSTAKTTAEIAQGAAALTADATSRGITVALGSTNTSGHCQLMVAGDSQTALGGGLTYYPSIIQFPAGCTWDFVNAGNSSQTLIWASTTRNGSKYRYDTEFRGLQNGSTTQTGANAMHIWLGTNDCAQPTPATAAQMYQRWGNIIRNEKAQGWKVLVSTMISRTALNCAGASCDSCKDTINPVIRNNWRVLGADILVDMAATQLGPDGACVSGGASGRLCSDAVHPTQDAQYNIVSMVMQRGLAGMYGNLDFNSATTYAAAAPAAVTITAATESTNTMTFTSASGAPPVGTCAQVSGVTPAGYNTPTDSCWNVLTSNGTTTWTAYNGTTGLAAGSVFGTFSFPQQKDADVFEILNFGAGNHTLEPCWMWGPSQNVTIKNINGAGSTIVPWSTETIDGAANLAIAANQTRILQSVLVSQAAAGCNWKVIQ